jgi:NAD(P)-dependent dehydrogenase (short-subunit alcohol dehydrogenase family)
VEVAGHTAIVTGAAAGTGRAIARRLAADGAQVVVADVDAVRGEAAAEQIGGRFVRTDVTVAGELEALIASAAPAILINNAGGGGHVPPHFPDAAPEDWGATLDLNLRAPMLATQLALEAGTRAVVNIASTGGFGLAPHPSPEYAAAKAGLIRFTAALVTPPGVRVNCVVPDWILTERAERELAVMNPEERAAAPVPIPMEDVAAAVIELIRDDTRSGRVVLLRGGEPERLLSASPG